MTTPPLRPAGRAPLERFWRRVSGVRVRVTAAAVLAVACALAIAAAVVEVSLEHDRRHLLVSTAQAQGRQIVASNSRLGPRLRLPAGTTLQSGLIQVVAGDRVVAANRPLRRLPPLWEPGEPQVQSNQYVMAGQARDVHVVAVPITISRQHAMVVVVTSLDQFDHSLVDVTRLLEIGMPVLLVVVGMICWVIVGRSLRPIEALRREVSEVAAHGGTHRVAEPPVDDEVGRLARTLNSMLDRLAAGSARERRFVSDASHELRSPLANIRTEIEVALHHPERADWPAVAREVLAQDERMARLVEELLLLARSTDGHLAVPTVAIDLAEVARSVVEATEGLPPVTTLRGRPALVLIPGGYLERILANLVGNARRYAATAVEVVVEPQDDRAVLVVRDDGPGIPESERDRIFERFVRLDEARDRERGGFGLGLAIVSDLCRAYGGVIEVGEGRPGAVFTLRFPLAGAIPGPAAGDPEGPPTGRPEVPRAVSGRSTH